MKLTFFLSIVAVLHANAGGWAQNISLSQKNASLENIFKAIEKQTGYSFLFEKALLQQAGKVDIQVTHAPIEKVLDICFKDQPLTYKIFEKTIVVRKKEAIDPAVAVAVLPVDLFGRVTDPDGKPLEGATVRVRGFKASTKTNALGEFLLRGIDGNAVLEISFVGFKTQTVHVNGRPRLDIGLSLSDDKLDETVVIAYGTTTRRYATGSVTKVTSDQIEKQPVANILLALQGLVPGLDIVQPGNYASGQVQVQIRGKKDLFSPGPNSVSVPLYVVDGVPIAVSNGDLNNAGLNQNGFLGTNGGQSPLYSLNPSDIESVEVLRDADATAIYGARAANGVILITTKKGKAGKENIQINAYTGGTTVPHRVKLLDTKQYIAMRREAFQNDGLTPDASAAPDLTVWDTSRYTDWQRQLAAAGRAYHADMSYGGGDDNTNYRISGGFHRETPAIPHGMPDNFKEDRISTLISLNHSSKNKKFNSALTINYAATLNNLQGGSSYQFTLPPDAPPILNAAGKLNWKDWGASSLANTFYNFTSLFQPYRSNTSDLLGNLTLSYNFFKGFSFLTSLGYSTTHMDQLQEVPSSTQAANPNPSQYPNQSQFGTNNIQGWVVEPRATYNTHILKGHLEVLAGSTLQQNITSGNTINASGFSSESLLDNLSSATTYFAQSNYALYRFQGYYGRINYNWDGKYILNLSGRRDGSSRFKANNQMGSFGSVGAAWIFTEEKLLKQSLPFLSFGKLRGSYGTTGSASSGDYKYLSLWQSSGTYDGTSVLTLINPANPDYKWQVNKKLDLAIDLGFFKDRIQLTAEWYRERCDNELINYPLPAYVGFYSVTANLPALVQNQGWEGTLSTTNIKTKDFTWTSEFNISINKNKLVSFPNLANSSYSTSYIVGKPLTIQQTLHYTGVDPKTGLYTFEDVNKDGNITSYGTSNDLLPTYDAAPVFFGGFLNNISYKNIQLSFLFQYKKQRGSYAVTNGVPGSMINQPVNVLGRWQKPGDITGVHKFTTQNSTDFYNYTSSDATVMDASFVRLQNLSLSYDLKGEWMGKIKMAGCRIYLRGQNLLTITSYKGLDPANPSLYYNALPPQKYFTGGIQLTF